MGAGPGVPVQTPERSGLGSVSNARGPVLRASRRPVGVLGNRKRFIRREWWSRARQEDAGIRNIFAPAPFPVPGGRRASRAERVPPLPQPRPGAAPGPQLLAPA